MSKIKKILGLASIGFLCIGTILGIATRERKPDFSQSKSSGQEDFFVSDLTRGVEIVTEQPQYVCVEDFLEMDENTLAFYNYNNIEVVECVTVGCGVLF